MGAQVDWETLISRARAALQQAYSPYSFLKVGAALATDSGETFVGCNIENASFGMTICAERVAAASAVAAGFRNFSALVLASDTDHALLPCGACRQFLAEFNPSLGIRSYGRGENSVDHVLSELLPLPFTFKEASED